MEFHQVLYRAASPRWLPGIMDQVNAIFILLAHGHSRLYPGVSKISYRQHQRVFQKIKKREFDAAKALLAEHIESFKHRSHEAYQAMLRPTEE